MKGFGFQQHGIKMAKLAVATELLNEKIKGVTSTHVILTNTQYSAKF